MLQRRPRTASITPGLGRIGTSAPAMTATCSDHGPVAFTTRSAPMRVSMPVIRSRTRAPETAPPDTSRSVTSTQLNRSAPLALAVAKKRSGMRIASIVASGTRTATFRSGFSIGSRRSASSGCSTWVGMPVSSHPSRNPGR